MSVIVPKVRHPYPRSTADWVYLTAVTGVFDCRIIGWALSVGLETGYTIVPGLTMASRPGKGYCFIPARGVRYGTGGRIAANVSLPTLPAVEDLRTAKRHPASLTRKVFKAPIARE
jgi:transposase InsO family protein